MTTARTFPIGTFDKLRGYLNGPEAWKDAVIARAEAEDCSLIHAANLIHRESPPETRCDLCGESTDAPHELCRARAARGLPTPPIPWGRPCSCAGCVREEASS